MLYKRLIINGEEYLLAVNQAGQGAPTESTVGAPGVLYMDTDTEKFYKCTAAADGVYTWKEFETGGNSSDSSQNVALTAKERNTLIAVVNSIGVFNVPNGQELVDAFNVAWGASGDEEGPDDPDTPTATLTSISAAYSGGDVAVGTAVTDLTGIVVTAYYSDGTSKAVTGYTLSGTIAEGENTVTVIYGGKMTEFVVVGVVETGEVVILKSITGDGASYIDTEITPESLFSTCGVDISIELSAKIADFTSDINLFGANQSKLYGSYGAFCANNGTLYCRGVSDAGNINSQDTNGFWNTTAVPNLYTEQRWFRYAVTKDGTLASVYMDEAMTKIPSSANADFTAFTNYDEESLKTTVPIIPMYIFAVNVGTDASQLITDKTPTAYTLYYFRIKKYSTDEVLHEFMPAMQGDRVGLYDTVTQKFYENKGTGSFTYEEVSA